MEIVIQFSKKINDDIKTNFQTKFFFHLNLNKTKANILMFTQSNKAHPKSTPIK